MVSTQSMSSAFCYSGKGILSIYCKTSFSRKPIILGVPIKSSLNSYGSFLISLIGRDFCFESSAARHNLIKEFGLGFSPFTDLEFFSGSLMDDFSLDELSETTSTFIVGGDLTSLGKARPASFIGNMKMIDDLIHLNTNFALSNHEFFNSKPECLAKFGKLKLIEFEIISKLKFIA